MFGGLPPGGDTDSGSQKVQRYLDISHICECRFLLTMVQTKHSSDLERVAWRPIVPSYGGVKFSAFHFHAAPFGIWSPRRRQRHQTRLDSRSDVDRTDRHIPPGGAVDAMLWLNSQRRGREHCAHPHTVPPRYNLNGDFLLFVRAR
eukprot:7380145-Prymnesium_polylepis.1